MKRVFDLFFSTLGLFLMFPLFLVIAVAVRFDSAGPVFFRQIRVGRYGRPFRIVKFRTMCADAEARGQKITVGNDPRITRVGRFLRKFKLDELPQLFNVMEGEMSLVGPRPEVPEFVDLYPIEVCRRILSVRPGMTDPASVIFRNENDILARTENPRETYIRDVMPVKLAIYDEYISRRSFWTDLRVILMTMRLVFQRV